jgi:hypothetical protein
VSIGGNAVAFTAAQRIGKEVQRPRRRDIGVELRNDPAAALRGLTNSFSSFARCVRFNESKSLLSMTTSPRTSNSSGGRSANNRNGMVLMVRRFAVTSSPE